MKISTNLICRKIVSTLFKIAITQEPGSFVGFLGLSEIQSSQDVHST